MKSILEFLEQTAERFPDKQAFVCESDSLSFAELSDAAKRIGTKLAEYNCRIRPVAILMDKSLYTIELMLGAVYAGGFYVILDAAQPRERLNRTLSTLLPAVLITDDERLPVARELKVQAPILTEADFAGGIIDEKLLADVRDRQKDTDPLYVLFTSGSTGVPKGVVVSHRSVIDFIPEFVKTFGITRDDVLGNQAPWDFDVSVKDIYSGLFCGATVVLIPKSYFLVPMKLLDYLDEKRVTNLTWAVSALTLLSVMDGLSYKVPADIRRVMFSGEAMPVRHFNYWRRYYPEAMFVNLYGPTEITCNCCYYIIDREFEAGENIPIGSHFDNETVFLLDEENRLVSKADEKGEICISGTALALGYYRNPEQTAGAFVQNPLNDCYTEMIYRSGDIGYYNKCGELCFAGRRDFQIKHMGHRIELGEIESAISKLAAVCESVCVFDAGRNKIICFYQGDIDKKQLAGALGADLPDYMIPNVFKQLESLPRNKNGKIDRKRLQQEYNEKKI